MEVHKNSGKKYCDNCYKKIRADNARNKYRSLLGTDTIIKYRETMKNNQRRRLEKDTYRLLARAKNRASCKNVECTITENDIIVPKVCPALGTPFVKGTEYAMSIDAIDPTKGYTPDNIQVISMKANAMKNSASKDELITFANWILQGD